MAALPRSEKRRRRAQLILYANRCAANSARHRSRHAALEFSQRYVPRTSGRRKRTVVWLPELRLEPDLAAFRDTVRTFLRRELAGGHTGGHRDQSDLTGWDEEFERAFLRRAGSAGLLGVSLPTEYGGAGRPRSWQAVVGF